MPKKIEETKECCSGIHKKKGIMMFILGLLVLGNAYYAYMRWDIFIGTLLILAGILKLIMPKHH